MAPTKAKSRWIDQAKWQWQYLRDKQSRLMSTRADYLDVLRFGRKNRKTALVHESIDAWDALESTLNNAADVLAYARHEVHTGRLVMRRFLREMRRERHGD